MADIGDVVVKLTADVGQFQTGMAAAHTSVQNFQNAATTATGSTRTFYEGVAQAGEFASGSERGVRRMEFAMGTLAASTIGANHAIGQLAEGFLLFTGGSALALGVLAGLAAIAGVIAVAGAEGAKTTRQLEEMGKELDKLGSHAKLMQERFKLDQMKRDLEATKERVGEWGMEIRDFYADLFGFNTGAENVARQQDRVNAAMREYNKFLEHRQELDLEHRLAVDEFVAREVEHLDLLQRELDTAKGLAGAMAEAQAQLIGLTQGPLAESGFRASLFGASMFGTDQMAELDRGIDKVVDEAQRELDRMGKESERTAKRVGMQITQGLFDGITGNMAALGNVLKRLFEEWVNVNIITPFLVGLQIFSPSGFGIYVGEMLAAGVGQGLAKAQLGPMGLNLNLNVNKSGNLSPFDMARDADWQRAFRETALVAHQQGFALPAPR